MPSINFENYQNIDIEEDIEVDCNIWDENLPFQSDSGQIEDSCCC